MPVWRAVQIGACFFAAGVLFEKWLLGVPAFAGATPIWVTLALSGLFWVSGVVGLLVAGSRSAVKA